MLIFLSLTTDEWKTAIEFLTRTAQFCSPGRQELMLLSNVFGVSALIDGLNDPAVYGGTNSSLLGPFFTEDAPDRKSTSGHDKDRCLSYVQSALEIPSPPKVKESTCTSRGVSWIHPVIPYRTPPSILGRQIPKVLRCMVHYICIADDSGSKVSTTPSIQTGPGLTVEEDCAVTTRVVMDIELLYPLRIQFGVMYGYPALLLTQTSNLV